MATIFQLLCVVLPLFVAIPLLLAVYVFRDAGRRNLNGTLWALVTLLVPGWIGFAVYLLIRSGHSDWKCPACGGSVQESFAVCPRCGCTLKDSCTSCGRPLEREWSRCPWCGTETPEKRSACAPVKGSDRWLKRILVLVLAVPVIILAMTAFFLQLQNRSAGINLMRTTPEAYLAEKGSSVLETWMENCEANPGRAYVLRHKTTVEEQPVVQYLIYYPAAGKDFTVDADHEEAILDTTLQVDFHRAEESADGGHSLCTVSVYSAAVPRLKLFSEGRRLEYEMEDVDFSLTFFEFLSS